MIENLFTQATRDIHIVSGFEVKQKAKKYEDMGLKVIHLELGEPDFDTPANITEAGIAALRQGHTHYGPALGIPAFRESIARYVRRYKNIPAEAANVVVTPGAKPILFYTLLSLIGPGDEVILPSPGFMIYDAMTRFLGGVPVPLPLREERNFRFDIGELESLLTPRTKLLILNSPQNPTGGYLTPEDLAAVADLVRDRNMLVLSDEIYDRMIYSGNPPVSIASLPGMAEKTIVLDGFSKTYAMTGWRLGYGVMPEAVARLFSPLIVSSNSCTASFTQFAGIEALEGDQSAVTAMIGEFHRRRDLMVNGFNSIAGIHCVMPEGAFYAFPNISSLGKNSQEMADYLLDEAQVACLPGSTFGTHGEGYLRFSYANSVENIAEALNRIEACVKKLK